MKINLSEIITTRQDVLNARIKELENIKNNLKISEPIKFSISEISNNISSGKKSEKVGLNQLDFLENIKQPVIYIYEICNPRIKPDLLKKIETYRSLYSRNSANSINHKRSISKIPNSVENNNSNILYVGSKKKGIYLRTKQHLGLGHHDTFSLQLKHWADSNWEFNFYYIEVTNEDILIDIEAAITKSLNPLLGKREN